MSHERYCLIIGQKYNFTEIQVKSKIFTSYYNHLQIF